VIFGVLPVVLQLLFGVLVDEIAVSKWRRAYLLCSDQDLIFKSMLNTYPYWIA